MNVSLTEQLFPVKNLTVGLYGNEQTDILEKGSRDKSDWRYKGIFEVVKLEVPIEEFIDGPPLRGTWSYPFRLELPDWLPNSTLL